MIASHALAAILLCCSAKLGPADKIAGLKSRQGNSYTFIVRYSGEPAHLLAELQEFAPRRLDIINAIAAIIPVSKAFSLSERSDVEQVWYLHPRLAPVYVSTIDAIQYHMKTLTPPAIVNLSIGPKAEFWRQTPELDEPMHAATRAAVDRGFVVVMAVGNVQNAAQRDGWINPWCSPSWVICVGAYDLTNASIADWSARSSALKKPDVVADGVDVPGPHTTTKAKTRDELAAEASSPRFQRLPPELQKRFTVMSGTSQAAAHVSGAAAQILFFLTNTIEAASKSRTLKVGDPLFSMIADEERVRKMDLQRSRYNGTVHKNADGTAEFTYVYDSPWKLVKQLLLDSAVQLDSDQDSSLVVREVVDKQFNQHGLSKPLIAPSKVTGP